MLDEVKVHFKRHKTVYISLGTGIVFAGITFYIMKGRTIGVANSIPNGSETIINRPFTFFSNKTQNIVNVFEREGRGHPGYLIECIETGERWESQLKTAAAVGIHPIYMSQHIRGELLDIYGKHYRRLAV